MPNDLTMVTELATALGTFPYAGPKEALAARPSALALDEATWGRLDALRRDGRFAAAFAVAFENGRTFLEADEGLRRRFPQLVEWTGGRRPPGDEVAPIDLRIDHVYLVSCKYLSHNISNPSPARLFEGLLATAGDWERRDWYEASAPAEYQALYAACRVASGLSGLPTRAVEMDNEDRRALRQALPGRRYPPSAEAAYRDLCRAVSERSAARWRERLAEADRERVLWRLLRIGNAPYFLLGTSGEHRLALRIDTPWDWRRRFTLRALEVTPAEAGQPQVNWTARYLDRLAGAEGTVDGHVEIRWSHGKFTQPPEAKVYLDTPAHLLPGYHELAAPRPQPSLFG
ncbi:MAG TPA: hypothetical protein VK277_03825 [Acidimicrobiales bacterium]|nr:hypothetical protein [Acidimicrobiales bacterium]